MEAAASQLLRALRGGRSQAAFARRLGYRGNPMTDWERGVRFPTAEETLRAAALLRIDVAAALRRFSPAVALAKREGKPDVSAWLDALRGSTSVNEVAERCERSRHAVGRWFRGQAKPRLPDFLRLVDAITGRAPDWVAELVPIAQVPALEARFLSTQHARQLAFEVPWTEAVLRLLETQAYRTASVDAESTAAWIADRLKIPVEHADACLVAARKAGSLVLKADRYRVEATGTVDTVGGKQPLRRLKQHWSEVAMKRIAAPEKDDLFAYNVASVSRADAQVIRAKLRDVFREIRSLVAASTPEETVVLLNLQAIEFDPESPE